MNISGIRTCAGFYDYNTIKLNEIRSMQIQEAKAASENMTPMQEDQKPEAAVTIKRGPDHGAEEYAKQYQPDAVYELKGVDSDIIKLDVEKALSDLKKDQVLEQYQFFVGDTIRQKNDALNVSRANENFILE